MGVAAHMQACGSFPTSGNCMRALVSPGCSGAGGSSSTLTAVTAGVVKHASAVSTSIRAIPGRTYATGMRAAPANEQRTNDCNQYEDGRNNKKLHHESPPRRRELWPCLSRAKATALSPDNVRTPLWRRPAARSSRGVPPRFTMLHR